MSAARTPREIAEALSDTLFGGAFNTAELDAIEAALRSAATPLLEAAEAVVTASNIRDVVYRGNQMAKTLPALRAIVAAWREQ